MDCEWRKIAGNRRSKLKEDLLHLVTKSERKSWLTRCAWRTPRTVMAWYVQDAIKMFETLSGTKASEAEKVDLYGQIPPIEKMDSTLASLKACKYVVV